MISGSALGALGELLVQAEVLAGSDGEALPSRSGVDVAHKDIVVNDFGGYEAAFMQVKSTVAPDSEGRIVCFADYPADAVPKTRAFHMCSA